MTRCCRRCKPREGSSPRGVSLVEMLVTAALLGVLLTYVYQFLAAAARYQKSCVTALELQKQSLTGMSAVTAELGESAYSTVKDDPPGLIFASPRDGSGGVSYDGSGKVMWRFWICYYPELVNGRPCLIRKTRRINPPTSTPPDPAGQSTATFRGLNRPIRTLVADLKDQSPWTGGGFSLTKVPAPAGGRARIDLTLKCRRIELGEPFELELKSSVELLQ